jgi:AcrR family transcriptional regulator
VTAVLTTSAARPARSARKAKGHGHLRRAEILRAAEAIFLRDGYHGATIRKIADEVGVSSTALYMHFRDKDEMLLEICETAAEDMLARVNEIAGRPIDAVSRVRLMMEHYIRFGLANPNTYQLAFGAGPGQVSHDRVVSQLPLRCYEQFRCTVADMAAEGRLRAGADKVAAHVLWAACHGLVALRVTRPDAEWEDDDTLIAGLLDSLFAGLAAV